MGRVAERRDGWAGADAQACSATRITATVTGAEAHGTVIKSLRDRVESDPCKVQDESPHSRLRPAHVYDASIFSRIFELGSQIEQRHPPSGLAARPHPPAGRTNESPLPFARPALPGRQTQHFTADQRAARPENGRAAICKAATARRTTRASPPSQPDAARVSRVATPGAPAARTTSMRLEEGGDGPNTGCRAQALGPAASPTTGIAVALSARRFTRRLRQLAQVGLRLAGFLRRQAHRFQSAGISRRHATSTDGIVASTWQLFPDRKRGNRRRLAQFLGHWNQRVGKRHGC